jgi:hypothetical protein
VKPTGGRLATAKNKQPAAKVISYGNKEAIATYSTTSSTACVVCNRVHALSSCDKFKSMNQNGRYEVTKNNRLCRLCLMTGHRARNCSSGLKCGKCRGTHHSLLQIDGGLKWNTDRRPEDNESASSFATAIYTWQGEVQADAVQLHPVLPIVPVIVKSRDGLRQMKTYAMLDSCSTHTFCTREMTEPIATDRKTSSGTIVYGGAKTSSQECRVS